MILCLGPQSPLFDWLGLLHETKTVEHKIDLQPDCEIDAIVSYGYRHKVSAAVLAAVPFAVNIHIGYLPYNRGAHPCLWSQYEGTPNGATVHHMDAGIDTGDIFGQVQVDPKPGDTLRTLYGRTHEAARALFYGLWPAILRGVAPSTKQPPTGTHHLAKHGENLIAPFPRGWDTTCAEIAEAGADVAVSSDFWNQYLSEIMETKTEAV